MALETTVKCLKAELLKYKKVMKNLEQKNAELQEENTKLKEKLESLKQRAN